MKLAAKVRKKYPKVPIVFYSRKATTEDVLQSMKVDGVFDVIPKLTGRNDQETRLLTKKSKNIIASRFKHIIDTQTSKSWIKAKEAAQVIWKTVKAFSEIKQQLGP